MEHKIISGENMNIFKKIILASAIAVSFAASAQASVTYTSTPNGTGLSPLGVPDTTTYGVVFNVPMDGNNILDSFSFFIQGNLDRLYGGVAAWIGTGAGPELFKSDPFGASFNSYTEVTIQTGGLNLTPGQQYVAYFSTSGVGTTGSDSMEFGSASDIQSGVSWDNAGGGSPNHADWNGAQNASFGNLAGSMTFSNASVNVPEPGSIALFGLGLMSVVIARRKSARNA